MTQQIIRILILSIVFSLSSCSMGKVDIDVSDTEAPVSKKYIYQNANMIGSELIILVQQDYQMLLDSDIPVGDANCPQGDKEFSVCRTSKKYNISLFIPNSDTFSKELAWEIEGIRFKIKGEAMLPWNGLVDKFFIIEQVSNDRKNLYVYGNEVGLIAIYLDAEIYGCRHCIKAKKSYILINSNLGYGATFEY